MAAVIASDELEAGEALCNVPVWFEVWEQCLSRFRPSSELSRLNAQAGDWVQVSSTLWEVIGVALDAARWTDGLVTPTVLDALVRIGYDRSFERVQSQAAHLQIALPPPQPTADWQHIALDDDRHAVRLPRGVRLDLGGVAKGWCAEQAARRLATIAPALVDAGGDIAVVPAKDRSSSFPIGIADPFGSDELVGQIILSQGCVATSGRDYRCWTIGDQPVHHLIAPHIGAPAETDVLAATVIAPNAMCAEAAAKTALLLGKAEGLAWLEAQPGMAGLFVCEDGHVVRTRSFEDYVIEVGVGYGTISG